LFQTNYMNKEVILVSLSAFQQLSKSHSAIAPLLSLSNVWHTDKVGCGRLLYDYKNLQSGTPINSIVCRDLYHNYFGPLIYPSATSYIKFLFNAKAIFPDEELVITKSDVHRAYHRFRWTARGSLSLALLFSPEWVAIPITGGFGSNGPPFIYDVFRRFLKWSQTNRLLKQNISVQLGDTFVDDMALMAPKRFADIEVNAHDMLIQRLLGCKSTHKREQSTQLDVIGYRFDAKKFTIGISSKGYSKLIYMFFVLIPGKLTSVQTFPTLLFQCLCGLIARYGFIIPSLRYTPSVFYKLLRGSAKYRRFTKASISVVQLWRNYRSYAFTHS